MTRLIARLTILLGFFVLGAATPALAADITVTVRNPEGRPVINAIVMLETTAPHPAVRAGNYEISQHDLIFDPFVVAIPVGSTISFPNRDKVGHHVYSFSPAKRFDLKLYSNQQTRSVVFDKVGVVAIGCNIHDSMQAFVRVVNTPYFAKTGADGRVTLHGVPNGAGILRVWHPFLRMPGNEISRAVQVNGNATIPTVVPIRRPAPVSSDY